MKMHEVAKHQPDWIEGTYSERYMPTEKELKVRFWKQWQAQVLRINGGCDMKIRNKKLKALVLCAATAIMTFASPLTVA